MPPFGPIDRRQLIQCFRRLGFQGPFVGGRHQFMIKAKVRLCLPNPHGGDIGRELLARVLRQAGVSREQWEAL
jgi:hypothetical protein